MENIDTHTAEKYSRIQPTERTLIKFGKINGTRTTQVSRALEMENPGLGTSKKGDTTKVSHTFVVSKVNEGIEGTGGGALKIALGLF